MNDPTDMAVEAEIVAKGLTAEIRLLYEWEVRYSKTWKEGTRIHCETWTAMVSAHDEGEARQIMAEEEPGKDIDLITRGERFAADT